MTRLRLAAVSSESTACLRVVVGPDGLALLGISLVLPQARGSIANNGTPIRFLCTGVAGAVGLRCRPQRPDLSQGHLPHAAVRLERLRAALPAQRQPPLPVNALAPQTLRLAVIDRLARHVRLGLRAGRRR